MMEINISKDVLILGSGTAAVEAARAVVASGYNAVVVGRNEVQVPDGAEIISNAGLSDLAGLAGDFRATIVRDGETIERGFGAVVVAPEYEKQPLNAGYGLALSDKVVTQSWMENFLDTDQGKKTLSSDKGATIAFVTGFAQEGCPDTTRRVLTSALAVQELENCSAYIYAGNVKVADKGLERLFTMGRHKGVVCFKPGDMPEITDDNGSLKIFAKDPVIREEIALEPDYIVVEEGLQPGPEEKETAAILRIDTDFQGFLPSNNVHRFPANSNREGIYVAADAAQAVNAALQVKAFIGNGVKEVAEDRAVVDENKCVICLTCYRCCPHGAIFWKNGSAVISPVACQGCGICASECPMDAIQIGEFRDEDLKQEVSAAVEDSKQDGLSIVAFCCQNSALEAGQAAMDFGADFPKGFRMVKVPCAGKVEVEFITNALVLGADGVIVAACHEGNCKAEQGNIYAKWRVGEIRQRLEAMGLNKEKVAFITVASNMADDFHGKVSAFADSIKA